MAATESLLSELGKANRKGTSGPMAAVETILTERAIQAASESGNPVLVRQGEIMVSAATTNAEEAGNGFSWPGDLKSQGGDPFGTSNLNLQIPPAVLEDHSANGFSPVTVGVILYNRSAVQKARLFGGNADLATDVLAITTSGYTAGERSYKSLDGPSCLAAQPVE